MQRRTIGTALAVLALGGAVLCARPAAAYVEAPFTLGKIIADSSNVLLMAVETVDKQKNLIVFRKLRDIKGKHPGETIKHAIEQRGFHPREWQTVMAWAEVGKTAVFFHNGGAGEVCIDNYWYQVYAGDWWGMSHAEPYFLRSFAGKPDKCAAAVTAMLAGQEVIVPCMADGDKNALQTRAGRMMRMKAGLQIVEYNLQRDFVDWGAGADEFRPVADMPGFSHIIALNRLGLGCTGAAPADINGDGKLDLCLFGEQRVSVLQNTGGAFDEIRLPTEIGARSASWADFDGDGKLDLLIASPAGLRLFRNAGKQFEDISSGLPEVAAIAAAWIDQDGDRRPDIVLAGPYGGLRLLRNRGAAPGAPAAPQLGKWYFIGPFDNTDRRGITTPWPPEREINLAAQYAGKGNEKIGWREGNFPDGQQHNLRLFKPEHCVQSVVYLYREIQTTGSVELPVTLGSDECLAVWLNGRRVYQETVYHPFSQDQVSLRLRLQPGKNTLLLKVCQGEGDWSFAFNPKPQPAISAPLFDDVSDAAGLGEKGAAAGLIGDRLLVGDVNGDGRADILFCAGTGTLLLNSGGKFVEQKDSGISFATGGVTPALGDFNGDGQLDLVVPQKTGCRLFRNAGGRFTEVTAATRDLAAIAGDARTAVWADFLGRGKPDLLVGCLRGPNRYLRNNGDGSFSDATESVGLLFRVYNTGAVAVCDLNNDKVPDVVFNNEGQEAVALLTNGTWFQQESARLAEATRKTAAAPVVPPSVGKEPEVAPKPSVEPTMAAEQPAQGGTKNEPPAPPVAPPASGAIVSGSIDSLPATVARPEQAASLASKPAERPSVPPAATETAAQPVEEAAAAPRPSVTAWAVVPIACAAAIFLAWGLQRRRRNGDSED